MNILEDINFKLEMKHVQIFSNFYIYNADFDCRGHLLTSLYGCPKIVKGFFDCSHNNLTSLEYCTTEIYGSFYCYNNRLESLEHCPKYVEGNFYCGRNKKQFTEEYVRSICEVKGIIVLNDY